MSCHDIGRGLNSVTKEVMDMYYEKKITIVDTKRLLNKLKDGVHWCDGNEYEAVNCLYDYNICGYCLQEVDEVENVDDIEWIDSEIENQIYTSLEYITPELCSKCIETLKHKCKKKD